MLEHQAWASCELAGAKGGTDYRCAGAYRESTATYAVIEENLRRSELSRHQRAMSFAVSRINPKMIAVSMPLELKAEAAV